jgi:hypothetical protein|nr:MAG TPA: DNA-directed DNA polymerase III [Podoviridae sp. ctgHy19]
MREYTVKNNDFTEFDINPDLTLDRVDRNDTHYYTDSRCPKCSGKKYISYYNHVEGGVCFLCGGTGVHPTKVIVRTVEYAAKLDAKRLEKARKTAEARNAEYLRRQGFSADGKTWVVMGETYSRKDELKATGCKWNPEFGWHFDHEVTGFDTVVVSIEDRIPSWDDSGDYTDLIGQYSNDGTLYFIPSGFIMDYVKSIREQYVADHAPKTEYFGSIGDKVEREVKLIHRAGFDTMWGTTFVYTFVDSEGHQFVWKTSCYLDQSEGSTLILRGTIKAHSEYRGSRQTELTRCKVV